MEPANKVSVPFLADVELILHRHLFWNRDFSLRFFRIILFLIILLSSRSFAEQVKILSVEAKKVGNYAEITVYTSEKITPTILTLESPNRIAMAFENSRINEPITIAGPSSLVRIIQAMQFDDNTVYVIVEPNEELTYDYASLIGKNKVILEVTKARPGSGKVVVPSPVATSEVEIEKPIIKMAVTKEAAAVKVIAVASKEVKVKAKPKMVTVKPTEEAKVVPKKVLTPLAGLTIVIDPGHGGKDPGYVGKYGTLEKFLTYKVALKLKRMLREAGANVILTRYSDVSVKNGKIVEIANSKNADVFIALHFNSYTSPRSAGSETFYYNPDSLTLAKVIQRNVSKVIKRRNRGVKKDMYYTIHHTVMPSALVEPIYLTNPKEEKLILMPAFQEKVAFGIYQGIKEYVKISSKWQRSRT